MRLLIIGACLLVVGCSASYKVAESSGHFHKHCAELGGKYRWIAENGTVKQFQCDLSLPEQWVSKAK